ncbi:MAG: hypothetical protein OJF47_003518 [Nitrospira sp.]|jgi:hypothetical protein|nr:MAG: hypothetical protein OJF47_003518 [Nitrospira sp.]
MTKDWYDIAPMYRSGWSGSCGCWYRTDGKPGISPALFGWELLRTIWSLLCLVTGRRMARGDGRRTYWGHKLPGRSRRRASAIYGRIA